MIIDYVVEIADLVGMLSLSDRLSGNPTLREPILSARSTVPSPLSRIP